MRLVARAIIETEASSTLVIHPDDRSTDFLSAIYAGLGYPVITSAQEPHLTEREINQAIERHSRCFILGHGGPSGLFSLHGCPIDDRFGQSLAKKPDGLYIWCNADAYAKRNGLSGLVSGMFISEVGEARAFGIVATQEQVDASNANFSKIVRTHLDSGQNLSNVRQCYSDPVCKITQFNQERLYIFDKGSPTPILHATSMAHPRAEPAYKQMVWPSSNFKDRYHQWQDKLAELAGSAEDLENLLRTADLEFEILQQFYGTYMTPEETLAEIRELVAGKGHPDFDVR